MIRLLERLLPVLRLTRVTGAFAAVGNVWFVILWSHANGAYERMPGGGLAGGSLWLELFGGTAAAFGLYAFAMGLNDVLDARRDRTLRPDRPVASGSIRAETAVTVVSASLIISVLGSTLLGSEAVVLTLILGTLVLAYNTTGRFVPAIGLVLLGLVYAGQMLVGNVELRFVWPVWLVMTHALVVSGVVHWLGRKVPPMSERALVAAGLGWVFWTCLLGWLAWSRNDGQIWPHWVPAWAGVGPLVLAVSCVIWCVRRVRTTGAGPRAAEKVARYGSLWLMFYGCAWMFGTGASFEAWLLAGYTAVGFVCVTVLRESISLIEQPVGYRR
ncbi:MAG: UbiA family prenyltransferase [Phycisphaerales bacterium JB037]